MRHYFAIITLILLNGCSLISTQKAEKFNLTVNLSSFFNKGDSIILKVKYLNISNKVIANHPTVLFQGLVSEPADAFIKINSRQFYFPLVNDNIQITLVNPDSINVRYEFSKVNENVSSYYRKTDEYIYNFHALESNCDKLPVNESQMIFESKLDSLAVSFLFKLYEEYKRKKDIEGLSLILPDLMGLIGTQNHPAEIQTIFNLLPDSLKTGLYGKQVQKYLDQSNKIKMGQEIDFSFKAINSNQYTVKEFQGKYVLLVFWATWCGPCLAKIPLLKDMYTQYPAELEIVSISIDNDIEKWKATSKELDIPWINIHFLQNSLDLKEMFFVGPVPYNVLLSKDGKIIDKNIELSKLVSILKK
jgi:thiol-disulfide isomerase/thioredoxin